MKNLKGQFIRATTSFFKKCCCYRDGFGEIYLEELQISLKTVVIRETAGIELSIAVLLKIPSGKFKRIYCMALVDYEKNNMNPLTKRTKPPVPRKRPQYQMYFFFKRAAIEERSIEI